MSHEAVTWAMDDAPMLRTEKGKPDSTARNVLQVLAEHANKRGHNARPSVPKIRYRTGYERRTVQRALRRLEDAGLIKATGVHNDVTIYALALHVKRPATDWTELLEEEEQDKAAAKERQRKARAKRAAATAVTHSDAVTVTDSDDVTEGGVTDSDDARHAVEERDVTHSESGCHALKAALTVSEPSSQPSGTSGDGRRPTTGSGGDLEGGSAAVPTAQAAADEDEEIRAAATGVVIGLLPSHLRDQLPNPVPRAVQDAIRKELSRGLTPDQLVERAARRWWNHGYEADAETGGPGILRPVGVAVALVRRGNCPSSRCDDGRDLDTGNRCRSCEREAEDRKQRREAAQKPVQATFLVPVPTAPAEDAPQPQTAAPRSSERLEIRDCDGPTCERVFRTVPAPAPAGLCFHCRQDAETTTDNRQAVTA
ncbi:helix-turn-helix domain-containing protein [Streptomyces sp. CCM_MD2014]|uniref:helix-turn-helix domain-containing protein n=1 Tax=Streptomyces sp. CCM_MD2014 TaxID=1561022 RepID=UPI0007768C6E|nr:helix-turn-helix domain-containing protein [Streptomyces sp. CCM_MD2014]